MGIGISCGEVIVGTMGPPTAQNFSAIGHNVNVSVRLEALTKDYGVSLIVSERVANFAGVDMFGQERYVTEARGRDEPVPIYTVKDPMTLPLSAD